MVAIEELETAISILYFGMFSFVDGKQV